MKAAAAAELQDLRQQAHNAWAIVDEARADLARMRQEADRARDAADRAEARLAVVQELMTAAPRAPMPREPTLPTPMLYVGAGGPYAGDDEGATATSRRLRSSRDRLG